jgi:hypothetical protein
VGGGGRLLNLYASQNIIRVIKSRRMNWAGRVARMGEMKNLYKILVRNLDDLGVDGTIIFERILGE